MKDDLAVPVAAGVAHTPGPWVSWAEGVAGFGITGPTAAASSCCRWHLEEEKHNYCHFVTVAAANKQSPALAFGDTKKQAEANAKLISLAPELAEALRMSESAINGFLNQCSDEEVRDSFGEFARATKAARAVLAKLK